jgi:hypothetical protein
MSVIAASVEVRERRDPPPGVLEVGIGAFAILHIGLALFMAVSPHGFYTDVGPFEAYNAHYIRDVASFYAAFGLGLALALRRPAWRVPMLTITAAQYALHSVNHLIDIGKAHPTWLGYFDFSTLAAATLLLAWLLRVALAEASASHPTPEGGSR